jgi:hypothetical protein
MSTQLSKQGKELLLSLLSQDELLPSPPPDEPKSPERILAYPAKDMVAIFNNNEWKSATDKDGKQYWIDIVTKYITYEYPLLLTIHYQQIDDSNVSGLIGIGSIYIIDAIFSFDKTNGLVVTGKIYKEGILPKYKSQKSLMSYLKKDRDITIYDIDFLKKNLLHIAYTSNIISRQFSKVLNTYFESVKPRIYFYSSTSQPSAIFFICRNIGDTRGITGGGSKKYKVHISVEIRYLGIVINNCINLYSKYCNLFTSGKIILPGIQHIFNKHNKSTEKHLIWLRGSAFANIVLYPTEEYDKNPQQFKKDLKPFIKEWSKENDKYGREENNLYFNERLSKSLYFAYGASSEKKISELEKILSNEPELERKFKNYNKLIKEKNILCKPELLEKHGYKREDIQKCLDNKYNISYDSLCSENPTEKDVWLVNNVKLSDELSFGNECYVSEFARQRRSSRSGRSRRSSRSRRSARSARSRKSHRLSRSTKSDKLSRAKTVGGKKISRCYKKSIKKYNKCINNKKCRRQRCEQKCWNKGINSYKRCKAKKQKSKKAKKQKSKKAKKQKSKKAKKQK